MKKIAVQDLKVGMYVVDTGLPWTEYPLLYSEEGKIADQKALDHIIEEGYAEVFIDPSKGSHGQCEVPKLSPEEEMSRAVTENLGGEGATLRSPVPLREEMQAARKVYKESIQFAKDFLTDARMGSQVDMAKSENLVESIIDSVARNADAMVSLSKLRAFDEYTFTHCINVSVLAVALGKHLKLKRRALQFLGVAGLFHDVGKALIPPEILNKPGKLTDEEFAVMQGHPAKGYDFLKRQISNQDILRGVSEHHEKYNGNGYPKGLAARDIAPLARLIAVADVYDALTSERVYKKGMLPNKALKIMYGMREQDFFPDMVEQFIKCLGIYPVGSLVKLTSGEYGVVSASNPDAPLYPTVLVAFDVKMQPKAAQGMDLGTAENLALPDGHRDKLGIVECLRPKKYNIDPAKYLM